MIRPLAGARSLARSLVVAALLATAAIAQTVTVGPGAVGIQYSGNTSLGVSVNGVSAGALAVAVITFGDGSTSSSESVSGVSDGTSSFTCVAAGGLASHQQAVVCYLLSANGGNKTYTATFGSSLAHPAEMWIFTATLSSGTWSYDASSFNYGNSTTANTTGNITLTGAAEFSVYASKLYDVAATTSGPTMYGSTPTEPSWSPENTYDHAYYSTATGTSGGGASTYSTATNWVAAIAAFKAGAAAVRAPCRLATLGAGGCEEMERK